MNPIRLLQLVMLLLLVGSAAAGIEIDRTRYMPLDEVRPGMKGVCRTVLSGQTLEDIPAEVLGVLSSFRPGQGLILVRFSGEHIGKVGLVEGMSGSPVYIGGRLVGAMAYGWAFAREPIAGLTPIGSMLELGPAGDLGNGSAAPTNLDGRFIDPTPDLERWLPRAQNLSEPVGMVRPMTMPLCLGGLSPVGIEYLRQWMPGRSLSPVTSGRGAEVGEEGTVTRLAPGGTVCFEAARGADFTVVGVGTVTEIIGDRVLAMGHPVLSTGGAGKIRLRMSTGYVQTVLPRQDVSFKIASPGRGMGTFVSDQTAGMVGKLGPTPPMVPVEVTVHTDEGRGPKRFQFELTDEPELMLAIGTALVASCLVSRGEPTPEATVDLTSSIELEGHPTLTSSNTFAGPKALNDSLAEVVNPLGNLIHNPFEEARFKSIHVEATVSQRARRAMIDEVALPRNVCRAGDTLKVDVTLQPVRSEKLRRTMELMIPIDTQPGTYELTVCDANADLRIDIKERPYFYEARNLAGIISILNERHPNGELVCRLATRKAGVAVGSRAFGALPASALTILGGQARSDVTNFGESLRTVLDTPYVVVGSLSTRLEVLPPEETSIIVGPDNEARK